SVDLVVRIKLEKFKYLIGTILIPSVIEVSHEVHRLSDSHVRKHRDRIGNKGDFFKTVFRNGLSVKQNRAAIDRRHFHNRIQNRRFTDTVHANEACNLSSTSCE